MRIALSAHVNIARRRRSRLEGENVIHDGHLAQGPGELQKALRGSEATRTRKLASRDEDMGQFVSDDPSLDDDIASEILSSVKVASMPKISIKAPSTSTSADFIFNPATHSTRYSSRHTVKNSLERRMPGFVVKVFDIFGEGQVELEVASDITVGNATATVVAKCLASSYDMAVRNVSVVSNGQRFEVRPADRARSPEDTVTFISRLVSNCLAGKSDADIPI